MASTISTECTSSDGPISGEWILTDVADNTQLGKEERIGDKGTETQRHYSLFWGGFFAAFTLKSGISFLTLNCR